MKRKRSNTLPLLLLTIPGLLYFLINNYIPMGGIILAFKDQNYSRGIFHSNWIGLKNFAFLFSTKDAWIMTRNTILYNLAFIVIGTILAITVAILMTEIASSIFSKVFQMSYLLPTIISTVVISYIVFAFLNTNSGLINKSILEKVGREGISWYTEKRFWPYILILVYLWKSFGLSTIIYMASIAGIDKSLYEAARIDGASKFSQIKNITLPLLKPTVIILTLMSVGRIMNSDFGLFYQVPMNSGALYSVTQTIDTFVYRAMMQLNNIGMATASGLYQSIVGFVLVMTANAVVRKIDKDNALF